VQRLGDGDEFAIKAVLTHAASRESVTGMAAIAAASTGAGAGRNAACPLAAARCCQSGWPFFPATVA